MDQAEAARFARRWADDWNSHDLEAILEHYTEDVVFSSPVAASLLPETGGVLRGKAALRAYWGAALARVPDLHFTVEAVYLGVTTLVINYRNQLGNLVAEVLTFGPDGLVTAGHGAYLGTDAGSVSGVTSARDD